MVSVAGTPDQHSEAEIVHLPAERLLVETDGRARVRRVQVAEIPGSRHVGHLDTRPPPGLPNVEAGPLRIGQGRVPSALPGILRFGKKGGTAGNKPLDGCIGVVNGNVRAPRGFRATAASQACDVPAVELRDQVPAGGAGRHDVLERPAEQP